MPTRADEARRSHSGSWRGSDSPPADVSCRPDANPEDVLADVLVHTQDALRPIGVDRHAAADALRLALDRTVPQKAPPAKNRADGLRLRATDMDWAWGAGLEVTGPSEDILLAVTGRRGALANLTGSGVTRLDSRCPQPASTR
jgi:hypothetical protein